MKDKTLTFIIGMLIGAIIASAGFILYLKTNKKETTNDVVQNTNFEGIPQRDHGKNFNQNGETPPEFPNGEMPNNNGGTPPEIPNGEMPNNNGGTPPELPSGQMPNNNEDTL
mgnify:CR=1 FL=1